MVTKKVQVKFNAPSGLYCNLNQTHSTKNSPMNRCRFCTDLGRNGYTCVLYNEQLANTGPMVSKCDNCFNKVDESNTTEESVSSQTIVKHIIKKYRAIVKSLVSSGIPIDIALSVADEEVMK